MNNIDQYWEAVQERVCKHCVDSAETGVCRLPANQECGLRRYFTSIVDTVLSVRSDSLGPYVKALRENVCAVCDHQTTNGACLVRTEVDCGLDRYFPMIVEIIEGLEVTPPRAFKDYVEAT